MARGERTWPEPALAVLLNKPGQGVLHGRLAPHMGQATPIDQAQESIAPKALQIPPQTPITNPRPLALLPQGPLTLKQQYQTVTGTLGDATIENGKVRGTEVSFTANGTPYVARLSGDTLTGTSRAGGTEAAWKASRASK